MKLTASLNNKHYYYYYYYRVVVRTAVSADVNSVTSKHPVKIQILILGVDDI
jgi:hypothetical protein